MHRSKHSNYDSLKLNSYKIDSSLLQHSLKELNEMKSELETTITHYRVSEENFMEENERLREEIQM